MPHHGTHLNFDEPLPGYNSNFNPQALVTPLPLPPVASPLPSLDSFQPIQPPVSVTPAYDPFHFNRENSLAPDTSRPISEQSFPPVPTPPASTILLQPFPGAGPLVPLTPRPLGPPTPRPFTPVPTEPFYPDYDSPSFPDYDAGNIEFY